ncbi:CPXCG motif-containing cysteine-rich protein [Thiorhodococcus minor]|uniref:CPXCG motif-containing cysteine-rich protein n=1 Tax=Thiorhodococcus minor TaxID=57489 RepID=A0A6M0K5L3_9GAMM|nr:CPXCG motif-containing cysteine-rich protein [Thiorhodococcus minor]NEV64534.1 CPXCG motif-containing cysteine-rich protein [Thiorhodococcus minor]
MNPIETRQAHCPWCDAPLEIALDVTTGSNSYIEDCQICCAPIRIAFEIGAWEPDEIAFNLTRDGD